jgi:hypothetical protein
MDLAGSGKDQAAGTGGSRTALSMKAQCLLRRKQFHTTAWMDARTIKLGVVVEVAELGGLWEIVEIFPYRLTDKQLRTRNTLILS